MANLTVERPLASYASFRARHQEALPLWQYAGPADRWNTVTGVGCLNIETLGKIETKMLPSLPDALAAPDAINQLNLRR